MKFFFSLLKIAFKGLWRRPLRTALAAFGVALAVATVLCLSGLGRGYESALSQDLEKLGFDVLVTAKGCPYEAATMILRGGTIPMYLEEDVAKEVISDPAIKASTRLFLQSASPGERADPVLHVGIESSYVDLKPWVKIQRGNWFSDDGADEVILGSNAADLLDLELGEQVEIGRQNQTRAACTVVGIFDHTGTQDDGTIFLPLKTAQFLFDQQDRVTGIGVKVHDLDDVPFFFGRMYDLPSVQVVTMGHVRSTILELVGTGRTMVAVVTMVAAVLALFGVMNCILFSVLERTPVLGVMKSLGAKGRDILLLIVLETTLICLLGSLLGALLAYGGADVVQAWTRSVLPYAPQGSLMVLPPAVALKYIVLAAGAGVLAGVYPGIRAARIDPIRAIRSDG